MYSIVIFAWASIYYYATNSYGQDPFTNVRQTFVLSNVTLSISVLLMFILVGADVFDLGTTSMLADIGAFIISFASIFTSLGFIVYGYALSSSLTMDFASKYAIRILRVATICSLLFITESFITLYSIFDASGFYQNFEILNSLYLSCDLACMATILYMFQTSSSSNSNNINSARNGESHASGSGGSSSSHRGGDSAKSMRSNNLSPEKKNNRNGNIIERQNTSPSVDKSISLFTRSKKSLEISTQHDGNKRDSDALVEVHV